jgi:hypothetical protein
MVCPVMKLPACDAKRIAAPAISSGSPMRPSGVCAFDRFSIVRIFPQRARKIGANETRRDAVDPHIVRPELDGEIARELHIRRLGDAISADDRAAFEAADGGDDDDRAVLAGDHLRRDQRDQPMIGDDVVVENLAELLVGDGVHRPVVRIGGGVADQHVIWPNARTVSSTRRCRCSFEEIFAAMAMARPSPYFALIAVATSRQGSMLREETTTFAPCSAIRSTIARPMPRDEPVTTATFPLRSNSDTAFLPLTYDVFCAAAYSDQSKPGKLKRKRR